MFAPAFGFYEGTALADKTFHGFRLNNVDGNLTIDTIDDDSMVVSLPSENVIDPDAYKHWFWTADTVAFRWGDNGHLLMEML
ncbi:hypothetical protein [Vulcanococcus sp.]|uniref:hypothetical protein n=1 Tax=Vulcanococcus sp. TaxID=2856995 RepID=UPI003BFDF344